jgi:hypothetical protein
MKHTLTTLLVGLLLSTGALAGHENGQKSETKLSANHQQLQQLQQEIAEQLRIPSKVTQFYEGEQLEVRFSVDSLGQIQVLEVITNSPFLEKQMRRSFKNIRVPATALLIGERFSMPLTFNR